MDERPVLVTLLGTLFLVIGFLSLLEGYMIIEYGDTLLGMDPESLGMFSLLTGITMMLCGIAAFFRSKPVWYICFVIVAFGMINAILTVPGGAVRFVLLLVVVSFLLRPQVKAHFRIGNTSSRTYR